jgi:hypothetical protein
MNFSTLKRRVKEITGSEVSESLDDLSVFRNKHTKNEMMHGEIFHHDFAVVIPTLASWMLISLSENKKSLPAIIQSMKNHPVVVYEFCNGQKSEHLARRLAYELVEHTKYSEQLKEELDQYIYKASHVADDANLERFAERSLILSEYFGPAVTPQDSPKLNEDKQKQINKAFEEMANKVYAQCCNIKPVVNTLLERRNHYLWLQARENDVEAKKLCNFFISLFIEAPWYKEPELFVKDKLRWVDGMDTYSDHHKSVDHLTIFSDVSPKLAPIPEMVALRKKIKHYKKTHPYYQKS